MPVIGPRRALIDHLRARALLSVYGGSTPALRLRMHNWVLTAPLWNTTEKLKRTITEAFGDTHYSHVITGTSAVYPPRLGPP